jgi:HK97 family phage prohead protease
MGALSGLSIGFRTLKSKIDEENGIRTLTEIELWETSLVTFPPTTRRASRA